MAPEYYIRSLDNSHAWSLEPLAILHNKGRWYTTAPIYALHYKHVSRILGLHAADNSLKKNSWFAYEMGTEQLTICISFSLYDMYLS